MVGGRDAVRRNVLGPRGAIPITICTRTARVGIPVRRRSRHRWWRWGRSSDVDDVEFATMTYIDWFNHQRLHGEITDDASYSTPAAFEAAYYRHNQAAIAAVTH